MTDTLLQLGVGGIFTVLTLREVFKFIREVKNGGEDGGTIQRLFSLTDDHGERITRLEATMETELKAIHHQLESIEALLSRQTEQHNQCPFWNRLPNEFVTKDEFAQFCRDKEAK